MITLYKSIANVDYKGRPFHSIEKLGVADDVNVGVLFVIQDNDVEGWKREFVEEYNSCCKGEGAIVVWEKEGVRFEISGNEELRSFTRVDGCGGTVTIAYHFLRD